MVVGIMISDEEMGQFISDQISADPEEAAKLRAARREGRLVARIPYEKEECCCGNPDCTDFEDRMVGWGIPLDEIVTETYIFPLGED